MNLDQIEQQLNDQAADLRATDARLTALAKMGYPVSTVDQAYAMAERLLWPSY